MNRFDVIRFRSLENSILALREINKSDTLRNTVKQQNLSRIQEYTDEIVNRLLVEKPQEYQNFVKHPDIILN